MLSQHQVEFGRSPQASTQHLIGCQMQIPRQDRATDLDTVAGRSLETPQSSTTTVRSRVTRHAFHLETSERSLLDRRLDVRQLQRHHALHLKPPVQPLGALQAAQQREPPAQLQPPRLQTPQHRRRLWVAPPQQHAAYVSSTAHAVATQSRWCHCHRRCAHILLSKAAEFQGSQKARRTLPPTRTAVSGADVLASAPDARRSARQHEYK